MSELPWKVKASLDFFVFLYRLGWHDRAMMLAWDGFTTTLRFSKRDRKALADHLFVLQLAGVLGEYGLFKGRVQRGDK